MLSSEELVIQKLKGNDFKSVLKRACDSQTNLTPAMVAHTAGYVFRNTNGEYNKFIQEIVLSDWDPIEFRKQLEIMYKAYGQELYNR